MKVNRNISMDSEVWKLVNEEDNASALIQKLLVMHYNGEIASKEVEDRRIDALQKYLILSEGGSIPFEKLQECINKSKSEVIIPKESLDHAEDVLSASVTP